MFKKISLVVVSIFIVIGCGSGSTSKSNSLEETTSFNKRETDIIYKYMEKFPDNVQVAIGKIKNGEVYYYGALNQHNNVVTINNQASGFMVGSISKVFTSTLLAQLVLEGKVTLDENIADQLPFSLHQNINMSYKQLASHTSGLGREPDSELENNPNYHEYNALDNSDIVRYLKDDLILKHDQNTFHYSNMGVGILGYMITHIANKPYENLLQERIFSRLSMHHSTTIRGATLVPALMPNDDPVPLAYKSAGGIISTVEDLYQFSVATFGPGEAYLLTQEATFSLDNKTQIGLGWFIKKDSDTGIDFLFHGGATQGYRSVIILDKENHNGIIILSNLPIDGNMNDISNLGVELVEEIYK